MAVVLLAEAFGIAAVNWFLGVVVDRQQMSLAGLDPDVMSTSSKIGGVVFGLYFALCALVALLVAVRNRAPAGFGRILLISAAVVHGLLGAFAWGLIGPSAFVFMVVVLALIVLLLMTYDRAGGPRQEASGDAGGDPQARDEPEQAAAPQGIPGQREARRDAEEGPQDPAPAQVTPPSPTGR